MAGLKNTSLSGMLHHEVLNQVARKQSPIPQQRRINIAGALLWHVMFKGLYATKAGKKPLVAKFK